jgi:hypothetical protein
MATDVTPVELNAPQGLKDKLRNLTHHNNGTAVPSPRRQLTTPRMEDDYTFHAVEAAKEKPDWYGEPTPDAPYGTYMGRPIIGRDSPSVIGGAYFSSSNGGIQSEILIVEDKIDPETQEDPKLRSTYSDVLTNLQREIPQLINPDKTDAVYKRILDIVYADVQKLLPYNLSRTEAIADQFKGKKINLGYFIKEKVGVCRQQALLSAYLLDMLRKQGYLQGNVSVDRNYVRETGDGHAWARFTDVKGVVRIIDPAQNYVGNLRDAEGEIAAGRVWDYRVSHGTRTGK